MVDLLERGKDLFGVHVGADLLRIKDSFRVHGRLLSQHFQVSTLLNHNSVCKVARDEAVQVSICENFFILVVPLALLHQLGTRRSGESDEFLFLTLIYH